MASSWQTCTIDDLCLSIVDCVNRTAPVVDGPTPFRMIRTTNVRDGFVDLTETRFVNEDVFKTWTRRQLPEAGDIILTREAPLGEVGLLRGGSLAFLGQRLVSYRVNPALLDNRYFLYYLRSAAGRAQVLALGSGATVHHMRVPEAKRLRIPTPPVAEQERIGAILGTYDDLIETNRRRVALLENMARGLFEEWFVRFRFPGHEAVTMVDTPNGPLPQGWRWSSFNELVTEVRDGVSPTDVPADTPYVGLEHLPRRSTTMAEWGRAADVGSLKLSFRRGDVLFGKIRPYFHKVGWAPCDGVASSDAMIYRPRGLNVVAMALAVASSDGFVAASVQTSNGTKMPRANPAVLRAYPVATDDGKWVRRFGSAMLPAIELAASLASANRGLAASRDLLLPRLISGQLSVAAAEHELVEAA